MESQQDFRLDRKFKVLSQWQGYKFLESRFSQFNCDKMDSFLEELKQYLLSMIKSQNASLLIRSILNYPKLHSEDLPAHLSKVEKIKSFYNFLCLILARNLRELLVDPIGS